MALPATDSFTDSDYTLLENHGSSWSLGTAGLAIYSNACYPYVSTPSCAYWNADSFDANQSSQVTIAAISAFHGVGPAVHVQNAAGSNFYCYYGETTQSQIAKCVSGTLTTLSASPQAAFAATDVVRLDVTVSGGVATLKAYINDVLQDTVTDSTYTSGSAGVMGQNDSGSSSRMDDWVGDNLGGATGRIMGSLAGEGGLAGAGGLAGRGGGLAG